LYREQFTNFEIPPKKVLSPDFSEAPAVPVVKPRAVTSWSSVTTAASIGVILTVVLITYQRQNNINTPGAGHDQSTLPNENKNSGLVQENRKELKERDTTVGRENNQPVADANAATIFPNSVILNKNINNKSMKSLDSLGIMLLASSSIMFDTTAQSNNEKDLPVNTETQMTASEIQSKESAKMVTFLAKDDVKKSKRGHGTFYASSLFWSGKNNELYLKGKIVVNFEKDNFIADGSCSFLGPVYLLIINGEPATPDSTIKLSKQQYQLNSLSDREATSKYGEKGRQGAVEISVIE
jgi:hypothetical protein